MQQSWSEEEARFFGPENPERAVENAASSEAAMRALRDGLKPPSAVVQEVMALCNAPDISMPKLRAHIERDAALAAQLVRVANSASFATRNACRSLDDAVVRLGAKRVRDVAAGLAALGSFTKDTPYIARTRLHCAKVALIVEHLGGQWRQRYAGDLFLVGLVHDIGKLVLASAEALDYERTPDEYLEVDHTHLYEQKTLGFDHAALGGVVLSAWGFPEESVRVVAMHHDAALAYQSGGELGAQVALLRLADQIDAACERDDDEPWKDIAHTGECSYLSLSEDVLRAAWPKFVAYRSEAKDLL